MKNKIVYLLFIFISSFFLSITCLAETNFFFSPNPITAGEPATLTIKSTEGKPIIKNFPNIPGVQWLNNDSYGTNITILNGIKYESTSYSFIVKTPGTFTMPSLEVIINDKEYITNPEPLTVTSGVMTDIDKYLFIEARYGLGTKNNTVYAGENIPLEIYIYKALSLEATPADYPDIKINNVIFEKFPQQNQQNERFAQYPYYTPTVINKNGINYEKTCFYTAFKPLEAGEINGSVSLLLDLTVPDKSSTRSSFFQSSFFSNKKKLPKLITEQLPPLKVKDIPPVPLGVSYVGLIGNFNTKTSLTNGPFKFGEPFTLKLTITGNGSMENLKPAELSIPNFTVYSPEVKKEIDGSDNEKITINYVLIPQIAGKVNLNLSFATFNTNSGNYVITNINEELNIEKGDANIGMSKSYNENNSSSSIIKNNSESSRSNEILYLNTTPTSAITIPLWKNYFILNVILIILGPLLLAIFELITIKKKALNTDADSKRSYMAAKRKSLILKNIKNSTENELHELINKEIIPYINDLKGLPPGATVNEIKHHIDKELADILSDAGHSSFMPGSNNNTMTNKTKLYNAVKHLSVILIIFSAIILCINIHATDTSDISLLTKEYNSENFTSAEQICKKNISKNQLNSEWIYNLANCYFQQHDYAKASLFYQRALLISPSNSEILHNLNVTRNKLSLPPLYNDKSFMGQVKNIRDNLRPDQWILIFAISWLIAFIAIILKRKSKSKLPYVLLIVIIVVAVISIIFAISLNNSLYSSDTAVITSPEPVLYTLPSPRSDKSSAQLNYGENVIVKERINNWIRIRDGKTEGWIEDKDIQIVWPYK